MDDALREKILASLDRPADAPSKALTKALSRDPAARAFAAGLRADDRALRSWPARERAAAQWEEAAAKILAALDEEAKNTAGGRVPHGDTDYTAPPAFDDDAASPMETRPAMSEPNEHDPDLENLAALTRTSLAPGAVPSVRPHATPSIVEEADDTSSGIVDIKQLSAIARESAAAPPPAAAPEPEKTKEAPKAEAEKPKEAPKAAAKPGAKKDDVMVTAKPAVALPDVPPPSRGGGPVWAIGGMVVMAAAFMVYNSTRSDSSPTSPSAVESNAPAPAAAAPPADPQATTTPPPAAQPESAPAAPAVTPPPVAVAAPTPAAEPPAPAPQAAPAEPTPAQSARMAARDDHASAAPARAPRVAPAAERAPAPTTPAPTTPAPARPAAVAAPAPPPAAPAPAARAGAAPAAAAGGPAPAASSVDDLLRRAAPTAAPAPTPAAVAPAADVPERLGRAQITGVLSPLNGAVRSCAQGETGTAPVAIVIGNDGAVRTATVSGQFAGTPVGTCIEGVVRRAHFPAFRAPTQSLMFPYVITPPR